MSTWDRIYKTIVVCVLILGVCTMIGGAVVFWRDDGDWPGFFWATGGVTAMVVIAFLGGATAGWITRRLRSWRCDSRPAKSRSLDADRAA